MAWTLPKAGVSCASLEFKRSDQSRQTSKASRKHILRICLGYAWAGGCSAVDSRRTAAYCHVDTWRGDIFACFLRLQRLYSELYQQKHPGDPDPSIRQEGTPAVYEKADLSKYTRMGMLHACFRPKPGVATAARSRITNIWSTRQLILPIVERNHTQFSTVDVTGHFVGPPCQLDPQSEFFFKSRWIEIIFGWYLD